MIGLICEAWIGHNLHSASSLQCSVLPIFTYPPWPGALFQADYSVSSSDYSACGANTGNSIRSSRWNTFPFSVIMFLSEREGNNRKEPERVRMQSREAEHLAWSALIRFNRFWKYLATGGLISNNSWASHYNLHWQQLLEYLTYKQSLFAQWFQCCKLELFARQGEQSIQVISNW